MVLGKCPMCGTALRHEGCSQCNGTGQIRSWMISRRGCSVCGGTGQIALCPNRFSHLSSRQPGLIDAQEQYRKK